MTTFDYTLKDERGLHIRPARRIAEITIAQQCEVRLACGSRQATGNMMFAILALKAGVGDTLNVTINGPDEMTEAFCREEILKALEAQY